jgi:tRNA pseudouridine38-40 synthase
MARYQVILAYDGTEFSGFQRQAKHKQNRTVQAVVEDSLHKLGWQDKTILAAGRTDAGVHASGQVIAFDLDWQHAERDLQEALNASLPPDTSVKALRQVSPDFHPRYAARSRRYQYRIFCEPVRDPLRERYQWRVWPPAELEVLCLAAAQLHGKHDFGAFGSPPHAGGSTVREVLSADWRDKGDELCFEITANAFLYRMVRRLVGQQVRIGQGKLELDSMGSCLQTGSKQLVKTVAPAHGLCLIEVTYATQAGSDESETWRKQ